MVLCKYFQHGNCRFGTKCNNEHFDIKQIIKTDLESAFNGKQWPFSCYGPFKDRPCIPNFIEDQSFEEVRCRFIDLQQKNLIDQYLQQFNMDMSTATNKIKILLQLTPEMVEIVTQLYDTPLEKSGMTKSSNPFGFAQTNQDPAAGSIFNKPVATATAGNIFGGSYNNAANNTAAAGNIFGGNTNIGASSNIFQTSNNNTQSVYGNFQSNQPSAVGSVNGGNLFASVIQQPNMFSQTPSQMPQQQMQPQPQNGTNIFGQAAMQFPQNLQTQTQLPPQQAGFFQQAQHPLQSTLPPQQQAPLQPQQQAPLQPQQQAQLQSQQQAQLQSQQQAQLQSQQAALQPQQQPSLLTSPANFNQSLYSRIEDLSAEDIEAFRADAFLSANQIPCVPPPKEFVN